MKFKDDAYGKCLTENKIRGVKNLSDEEFTQEDRRKCEIQLHRLLAWVGEEYSESLDLPYGRVHLRNLIFNLITKNRLSSKDLKDIGGLLLNLREIKLKKESELATLELTISEGEKLCHEIAGLIRALDTLKDMPKMRGNVSFHDEFKENGIKDGKRWIKYLENVKK